MLRKFFIVFFAVSCAFTGIQAQKVHKILFGHTTDKKIGATVEVDITRVSNEIDAIGSYLNYEVKNYIYNGDECSKENLEKVLSSLSVSNKDIIVFYYSGHGGHANGGFEDKWPQMCLNKPQFQDKYVPLRKVIDTLGSKHAHFTLILSDCCNSIDETGIVTVKGLLKGAGDDTTINERTKQNYINLFTKYSGVLPITSSKLGQTSGCNSRDGGYFTYCFFNSLYESVNGTAIASWESIVKDATSSTLSYTRNEQEPIGDMSLLQYNGSTPTNVVNVVNMPPTPIQPTIDQPIGTISKLDYSIRELLSISDRDVRLSKVPSILQECFSNDDVYVVTMGRNLTTAVEYESAKKFLKRIAQSDNIIKINIVKEHPDANGKCSYVTVHEVRKY